MSGLDDLLKGIAVFNQGITQLATSRAINDANEQVQMLNSQELDRGQRLQAMTAVGNELSMRLGAAGADAGMINQLTSQLAPSAGAQFQAEENKQLQASSQAFQAEENERERAFRLELENRQRANEASKDARKRQKDLGAFMTTYQKEFNAKTAKATEALTMSKTVQDILKSGNPTGARSIGLFMAKLVQGGSQLSDAEREIFDSSPDIANKARSIAQKYRTGDPLTPDDRKFMTDLAGRFAQANENKINIYHKQLTEQAYQRASNTGYDFDRAEIANWFGRERSLPKQDPRISQLEEKLKQTTDPATKLRIENAIKKLKGM